MLSNLVQRVEKKKYRGLSEAATKKVEYSHDLFANEAISWIEKTKIILFLYLPLTIPLPTMKEPVFLETGPVQGIMESIKTRIGPIGMNKRDDYHMDKDVGRILDLLENKIRKIPWLYSLPTTGLIMKPDTTQSVLIQQVL